MKNYNGWTYSETYNYAHCDGVVLTPQGFRLVHGIGGLAEHLEEKSDDLFPALGLKKMESDHANFFKHFKAACEALPHDLILCGKKKLNLYSTPEFWNDPIDCAVDKKANEAIKLSLEAEGKLKVAEIKRTIGRIGDLPALLVEAIYYVPENGTMATEKTPIAIFLDCSAPFGSSYVTSKETARSIRRLSERESNLESQAKVTITIHENEDQEDAE